MWIWDGWWLNSNIYLERGKTRRKVLKEIVGLSLALTKDSITMIENIKYYKNRDREKEKNNTKERKTLKATPLFSVVI